MKTRIVAVESNEMYVDDAESARQGVVVHRAGDYNTLTVRYPRSNRNAEDDAFVKAILNMVRVYMRDHARD